MGLQLPLTFARIVSALGFTPVNKAGDTMTGDLIVDASSAAKHLVARMSSAVGDQGGLVVDQGNIYRLRMTTQLTGSANGEVNLIYEKAADKTLGSAALNLKGIASLLLGSVSMCKIASGSYTGDGTASRTITVGFAPRLVIAKTDELNAVSGYLMGFGMAGGAPALGAVLASAAMPVFQQTSVYIPTPNGVNGFTVGYSSDATGGSLNDSGKGYSWVAIG